MTITTINALYAAINPLPAMLLEKGYAKPHVKVEFEANTSRIYIWLAWEKQHNPEYHGQQDTVLCKGDTFDDALTDALEKIAKLATAKELNTHAFMRDLAKLIENGDKIGLEVEFMNPLVESMKKLSENIITHQPGGGS